MQEPQRGSQLGHSMSRESASKRNFVALSEHVSYFRNLNKVIIAALVCFAALSLSAQVKIYNNGTMRIGLDYFEVKKE